MTDTRPLVERLRAQAAHNRGTWPPQSVAVLWDEAADEIKRLEQENGRLDRAWLAEDERRAAAEARAQAAETALAAERERTARFAPMLEQIEAGERRRSAAHEEALACPDCTPPVIGSPGSFGRYCQKHEEEINGAPLDVVERRLGMESVMVHHAEGCAYRREEPCDCGIQRPVLAGAAAPCTEHRWALPLEKLDITTSLGGEAVTTPYYFLPERSLHTQSDGISWAYPEAVHCEHCGATGASVKEGA